MNTITFLAQTALFASIADSQLAQIAQDFAQRRFSQGEIIFREGDPGQVLYMVQTGQVRIFVNGIHGSETSVILCGRPGEVFGELAVIDGLPRSATAVAMAETTLLTIGRENFRKHMRQSPQLALNFLNELSVRVRYNTRQMNSLTSMDVPQRLARKLMELAQSYGLAEPGGVRINMPLTQSDLASLIGATRESINKSLRDFRQRHLIHVHHGQIIILDPEALRSQVTA
jgi:CRP/FNR family transcriptional regulator, cyclic AMP receptor protein